MKRHSALVALSRQHHDGLALGVSIDRDLRASADEETARRLRAQVADAWEMELRGHFAVEEDILFPVARQAIPDPGLVDRLVREHGEIRDAIGALQSAEGGELIQRLRALREMLIRHIRCEERELFESMQASLAEPDLATLGRRIDEELPQACVRLGSADMGRGGAA